MSEPVAITLISTIGAVLVALIGKLTFDLGRLKRSSEHTQKITQKVESSLNNSPETITERLAGLTDGLARAEQALSTIAGTLADHGKDIRGIRGDIGQLWAADREQRQEAADIRETIAKRTTHP